MKNKKPRFGVIAIAAIIFTLAACGGGKPNGTYTDDDGNVSITFSGKKFTLDDYGQKIEGIYKIKDGQIHLTFGDQEEALKYSLEGNTLTLDDEVFTKKTASKNGGASSLVGRWVPKHGGKAPSGLPDNLELFKDGTGICEGMSISWKVENRRFILTSSLIGGAWNYKMSDNKLILTDDRGESETYEKVR